MPNQQALQVFYGTIPLVAAVLLGFVLNNKRIHDLGKRIDDLKDSINSRLSSIENRLTSIETRLSTVEREQQRVHP